MRVKFWGVRGSIPAPLTPEQIRSRIASVIARARPSDLESARTRDLFLAGLPASLFGTVGGNTTCLEVRTDPVRDFLLLFTHFHWDHLQGIPFFGPGWVKGNRITFASPMPSLERVLRDQMKPPYFPVTMDAMSAELAFRRLEGDAVRLGSAVIQWKRMNHPGGSYAYRIAENGKVVIFATDSEVTDREFQGREENRAFFERADLLILDSQYTLEESFSKFDYGHIACTMAVNLAVEWKVKSLVLFHHEPRSDDRKIHGMARRACFHLGQLDAGPLSILTAQEGLEIAL